MEPGIGTKELNSEVKLYLMNMVIVRITQDSASEVLDTVTAYSGHSSSSSHSNNEAVLIAVLAIVVRAATTLLVVIWQRQMRYD